MTRLAIVFTLLFAVTGLAHADSWGAQWIASPTPLPEDPEALFGDHPAPRFRAEFDLGKPVERATARVSGLGYYVFYLNGDRVGAHELDPGWTDYADRVFYATYDVTAQLKEGANAAGLEAGNGWWNPLPFNMWNRINIRAALPHGRPRVILELEVTYADGSKQAVTTSDTWKTAPSPTLRNSIYTGEVYDARLETPGWTVAGFDDTSWDHAIVAPEEVGTLEAQPIPPVRVTELLQPVAITQPAPETYLLDFGVNMAGRVRITVSGPTGQRLQLRYGELVYPDGTLNPMTAVTGQVKNYPIPEGSERPSTAEQRDTYILRGEGTETWAPQFGFHGFRYVEVAGWPGAITPWSVTAERLHTDVRKAGEFVCSNELINQIQTMSLNTFRSNLHSVQSDCPGREKFQYGGDIVATLDALMANFDMNAFYAKTAQDHVDAQRDNGGFTETAPFLGIYDASLGGEAGPIGWGTAHPLLVARHYQWYGDKAFVARQYPAAKRWGDFLMSKAIDGILDNGLGDHETIAPKDTAVSGTWFYLRNLGLLAHLARIVGETEDATRFEEARAASLAAFESTLYNPETGAFGNGTQASQCFGIDLGLGGEAAVNALLADIEAHDFHVTTGIFGTERILPLLSETGHHDIAARIATQRDMPSWGYMLDNGATTLWEHWEGSENTFSQNHPMFGSISAWFYQYVLGIRPADDAVGFDKVIIEPGPTQEITWARGSYASVHGPITVDWRVDNGRLYLETSIPEGVNAEAHLPGDSSEKETVSLPTGSNSLSVSLK